MPRRSGRSALIVAPKCTANYVRSDDFSIPDFGAVPLVFGSPEVVEGYYTLETLERNLKHEPVNRHPESVDLWYRLLTALYRAFTEDFRFSDGADDKLTALQVRAELLALSLTSSKAGLDLLLAGYYSPAYATIRHMIETGLFCRFIDMNPGEVGAFYASETDPAKTKIPQPNVSTVVRQLKQGYPNERKWFESLHKGWRHMSNGSHPTAIGIVQTREQQTDRSIFGATYHPTLFLDGMRTGLVAVYCLAEEADRLQARSDAWRNTLQTLNLQLKSHLPTLVPPQS